MKNRIVLMGVALSLLSGCGSIFSTGGSSNFTCPGMPKGVVCKSPREVYELSMNKPSKKGRSQYNPGPVEVVISDINGDTEPMPILEQASVMRIWVAPWKDSNSDLHWPGLIFTKIKGHDWAIGDSDFNGIEPPAPRRMAQEIVPLTSREDSQGQQGNQQPRQPEPVLD